MAALLAIAKQLSQFQRNGTEKIRFVTFVNEEPPFTRSPDMGSSHYAKYLRSTLPLNQIEGMIVLETIGYFTEEPNAQTFTSLLFFPIQSIQEV